MYDNPLMQMARPQQAQNKLMMLAQAGQSTPLPPLTGEVIGKTAMGRQRVKTSDGGVSTERSATEFVDGAWRNFPTMFGGQELPVEQAIEIMRKNNWIDPETGEKFWAQPYSSVDEAVRAAQQRSGVTLRGEGM